EKSLPHRDLKEFAGGFDFVALSHSGRVAEENHAHFRFFKIERESELPAWKLNHLVQHHFAQALDAGDAVSRFANDTDITLRGRGFEACDLCFDFFQNAAHVDSLV